MDYRTEGAGVVSEDVKETGWDRVKSMFTRNQYGEKSPEMDFIVRAVNSSILCGGVTGAILAGNEARQDFLRKHKEMMFSHHYIAKRRYIDHILLAMGKTGFSWGWRMALFVGSCVTVTTMSAVYQNKVAVQHFTLGGAVAGGLFRVNMGVRGTFAASVLGGVLGTGAGILVVAGMWATGTSLEEMRYLHYGQWQKEFRLRKEKLRAEKLQKQLEEDDSLILLALHSKQKSTEEFKPE